MKDKRVAADFFFYFKDAELNGKINVMLLTV
jgi:hypothetical protein